MAACRVLEEPFYGGQMPVQDTKVVSGGGDVTVTKYGIGARGIDLVTKKVNSGSETFGFPLYDVHGNMVATLARSGSNSYSTGNALEYDVWGGTRSGSSTVDQKYCANLGHRSDAENGLQYMRARYYDPTAGRFVSEDDHRHGLNWYVYVNSDPVGRCDISGRFWVFLGRDEFPYLDMTSGDWWDPVYHFNWDRFVNLWNISITIQVISSGIDLAGPIADIEVPGWDIVGPIMTALNLIPQVPTGPLSLGLSIERMWLARIAAWAMFLFDD